MKKIALSVLLCVASGDIQTAANRDLVLLAKVRANRKGFLKDRQSFAQVGLGKVQDVSASKKKNEVQAYDNAVKKYDELTQLISSTSDKQQSMIITVHSSYHAFLEIFEVAYKESQDLNKKISKVFSDKVRLRIDPNDTKYVANLLKCPMGDKCEHKNTF